MVNGGQRRKMEKFGEQPDMEKAGTRIQDECITS